MKFISHPLHLTKISVITDIPVYSILFHSGRNNEIHKKYLENIFENVTILGFLMADISSKQ